MNLEEELLKECSKEQITNFVKHVGNNQFRFDELMYAFFRGNYRLTQRSAQVISQCLKTRPWHINRWTEKLIMNLQKDVSVSMRRNTVRLLQYAKIPENLEGITTEICFDFLNSGEEPVAVKVFSMTVLGNICKKHPELAHELRLSIEAQLPFASAGFHSRAKKVLKNLDSHFT